MIPVMPTAVVAVMPTAETTVPATMPAMPAVPAVPAVPDVRAYVSSDARCTRELVLRRWPTARNAIDRGGEAEPVDLRRVPEAVG